MANETAHNHGVNRNGSGNKIYGGDVNWRNSIILTNQSGGSVTTADVVVLDSSGDARFKTNTTSRGLEKACVVPQLVTGENAASTYTIASTETGYVVLYGNVPSARVNGQVAQGECLILHSVAKELVGTDVIISATQGMPYGTQAIALEDQAATGNIKIYLLAQPVSAHLTRVAATDPGVGDDTLDGYTAGSISYNTATNVAHMCESAAAGAAVWNIISGYQLGATSTPSAAASVDFQDIPQTGNDLHIVGELLPAQDDVALYLRFNNRSGASDYSWHVTGTDASTDTADSELHIVTGVTATAGVGNGAAEGVSFHIVVPNYKDVIGSVHKKCVWTGIFYQAATAAAFVVTGAGAMHAAEAISRVTLLFEGGNITNGKVRYYLT